LITFNHEKTFRDLGSGFVMKQKGFTLIELLVVVANELIVLVTDK